jgi:hypothetical protein
VRLTSQAHFRSYHSLSVLVSSTAISFETLVLDSISLHSARRFIASLTCSIAARDPNTVATR